MDGNIASQKDSEDRWIIHKAFQIHQTCWQTRHTSSQVEYGRICSMHVFYIVMQFDLGVF